MTNTLDPLRIRKRLGKKDWMVPQRYGDDGWWFDTYDLNCFRRILVSEYFEEDGTEWIHASMSYSNREIMPTYDDLVMLHRAIFPGFAYQVFAPPENHINITANVLHLWGRADGQAGLPDFGRFGTI